MKKFMSRRRLSVGAAWLCLALCALLAISWLASSRWTMFFIAAQFGDSIILKSGTFSYLWTSPELRQSHVTKFGVPLEPQWEWHFSERATPMEWWTTFYASTPSGRRMINVPLWIPFILFAGGGAILFRSIRRESKPGCCTKCGYDLRGIPANSPCPECAARPISFMQRISGVLRPATVEPGAMLQRT